MDHLRELLLLAELLDVTQTLARCLNVVFALQGLCYNTAAIIGQLGGIGSSYQQPTSS
jgi:phage shock protein PspC (stress-responsive transcriptional regulator)